MVFVRLENADELVTLRLWEAGTLGITEGDGFVDAFFADAETASQFGVPEAVVDVNWVARTQESFPPLLVGEKFFVAAPWRTEPTPPGRMRLVINPGAQCGTGYHRCTQLCLEAMEKLIRPGDSLLDVGSGSGILSLAAKLLGAGRVVSCDIDADAAGPETFFIGSVDAVRSGTFDVVVANINEDVMGSMRLDFERVARKCILSGFQDENGEWTCIVV
ncbi:MAG: 50S ribosomal protein L11 methyltransferase [Bryobacteraceae bacterium]